MSGVMSANASYHDALGEVNNLIERWEGQRAPYSDNNAKLWINCNVIGQRMIKSKVQSWIEQAFESGFVVTKTDLPASVHAGFVRIMADFLERHHPTNPPPNQTQTQTGYGGDNSWSGSWSRAY